MACIRFAAWRQTTAARPFEHAAVISSPRWAGQAVQHDHVGGGQGQQRLVDGEAGEGGAARAASSSWPIEVQTSV